MSALSGSAPGPLPRPIAGSVALVTGGQRGLGKAITDALLAAGATKVYVTARTPVPSTDPRIVPLSLEVTDRRSVRELVSGAPDVSIVVNNAGANVRGTVLTTTDDDLAGAFDVNVTGLLRVSQEFAPVLAANGGGTLVNILSVQSWTAGSGVYGASKAAAWSITNSLRVALTEQRTHVLGVHLSYTATDMTAALDVAKNTPEDVAQQVVQGIENGSDEVLTDDSSRAFKAVLSGPVARLRLQHIHGELRPTPA
jgi:NAD(P)-dependent dehydrogenase (short-subunit alcohol dehydrogenase family)